MYISFRNAVFEYRIKFGNYFIEAPMNTITNSSIDAIFYHPKNDVAIIRLLKDVKEILPAGGKYLFHYS